MSTKSKASLLALLASFLGSLSVVAVPFTVEGPGVDATDFRITTFVSGLDFPLGMAELADGSILATVNDGSSFYGGTGRLIRLVDTDGDGEANEFQTLFGGLPGGQTAVRVGGSLVFVTGGGKPITILRAGESPADPLSMVGQIVFNYPGGSTYHAHSTLELRERPGIANRYDLFFQIGADSNDAASSRTVTIESTQIDGADATLVGDSAYMMTIEDEGDSVRMVSLIRIGRGLRNAAGFALHPTTGDLYLQDNGIDGLVDRNEPHSADEINFIAREEIGQVQVPDFGFPDNYTAYRTGEIVGGAGVQPLVAFQPIPDPFTGLRSEGPNDIAFAPPGFPEGLNRGLFVGFHGKFNAGGLANDENPVVYADPETGEYFHFIRGQQEGVGHLDGLLATRDSLFIAELVSTGNISDGRGKGAIYQVKALTPATPPELTVRRVDTFLELRWDRGSLQKAEEVAGPWENLDDVFSPLLVEPNGSRRFYRAIY